MQLSRYLLFCLLAVYYILSFSFNLFLIACVKLDPLYQGIIIFLLSLFFHYYFWPHFRLFILD